MNDKEQTHLRTLLTTFDATSLGQGDPDTGANVLATMVVTLANISPPGCGIVSPKLGRIRAGASVLVSGGFSTSLVADNVVAKVAIRQNNLTAQLRRLIGDKAAGSRSTKPALVEFPAGPKANHSENTLFQLEQRDSLAAFDAPERWAEVVGSPPDLPCASRMRPEPTYFFAQIQVDLSEKLGDRSWADHARPDRNLRDTSPRTIRRATGPTRGVGIAARRPRARCKIHQLPGQPNRPPQTTTPPHDQTMSNTRTTRTQEPPPGRKRPKQDPASSDGAADTEDELDRIGRALELLAPLLDFHKRVESARDDDLRIYWDVRVVRGQDSPFAHVTGSSSLPGALGPKMKALAPSVIQEEITEKIARPLTALLQAEAERLTMEELAARDGGSDPDAGAAEPLP